jgi:hypothetical protein
MKTAANILAATAIVFAVSVASVGTAEAFPFFPSWSGLSGLDLGSGR